MREMGGVDRRQAGACSRGRGDIVRGQPVGLFGSGAPLSASVCLGRRRGSVSCIINEGGRRPVQQRPAAKVSPSCHQPRADDGNDGGKARPRSARAGRAV